MKTADGDFLSVAQLRRALVEPGDVRGDVDFQNDVNGLLAGLVERIHSFECVGGFASLSTAELPSSLDPPLREPAVATPPAPGSLSL